MEAKDDRRKGNESRRMNMTVNAILKSEEGDVLKAAKSFFAKLFEEGVIDYLLAPQHIAKGRSLTQTLVKGVDNLEEVNPFSPVMAANSATMVAQLSNNSSGTIGVVMKPCELRALVELVKLGQAKLDNLFVIGVDCAGTFEVEDFSAFIGDADWEAAEKEKSLLADMYSGKTDDDALPMKLRSSCMICNAFTPHMGDVTLNLLGMEEGILVTLDEELAGKLGLEAVDAPYSHESVVDDRTQSRGYRRERAFEEFRDKMKSIDDMADIVATCSRCYACQSACPICYCRVCFFRTETFEPESDRFLRWADKEGAVRMPPEILLYHLTRLNHMAASCIGCGMCESSCARGIPLSTLFQAVGDEVQKKLEYTPGKSVDDELPVATFRKEE
jgi:formate dehydrogenase (coenzyme F420) beta subunit